MHIPVLLNEVLEYLDPKPGDNFIDCTVGEGGHALAILKLIAPDGLMLGIDRDADSIENLRLRAYGLGLADRLILHHGNFADIKDIVHQYDFGPVNGIVFDFGLSSWQLEKSGAGFSFLNSESLDMRFNRVDNSETAAHIVNSWPEESIAQIIYEFGEERRSRRIAKAIVTARKKQRIVTTDQLAEIISSALASNKHAGKKRGLHPATRTFQALRIAVNNELENIEKGLSEASSLLSSNGRIAAISFHSLEDRRVKVFFREKAKKVEGPAFVCQSADFGEARGSLKILTKKPVRPSLEEIKSNPRSRSAKLRVAEKFYGGKTKTSF